MAHIPSCLILNASNEFLCVRKWRKALNLLNKTYVPESIANDASLPQYIKDMKRLPKMEVLAWFDESENVHSFSGAIRLPAVMRLTYWTKTKKSAANRLNAPSLRNVLIRDNFTCQYCGAKVGMRSGTRDHVMPRSKGGPDVIENVVAACRRCNSAKDNMSLRDFEEKFGFKLANKPRALTEEEKIMAALKGFKSREKNVWIKCLEENGISLW